MPDVEYNINRCSQQKPCILCIDKSRASDLQKDQTFEWMKIPFPYLYAFGGYEAVGLLNSAYAPLLDLRRQIILPVEKRRQIFAQFAGI